MSTTIVTDRNWTQWSKDVASPAEPQEHSPAAIERLMKRIIEHVVDIKNIRPQFRALNSVQLIDFKTPEDRLFYEQTWERYLKEKAAIEARFNRGEISGSESNFCILAQMTKQRECAEGISAANKAEFLDAVVRGGKAGVAACAFKTTIAKVVKLLIEQYGYKRDDISLIWGGASKKRKVKKAKKDLMSEQQKSQFEDAARSAGMDEEMIEDMLNIQETVEQEAEEKLDPSMRLGAQSKKQRQEEIDRFQRGQSKICIFTFKSGGVGLSLHHTDEFTKEKVKRKPESNYAYEDDIPKIPTRPREVISSLTFSAIEMVQGLGRAPRLTSLSDTPQIITGFRGTIEEHVLAIIALKLKCLKKVVRQKESWEDIIRHPEELNDAAKQDLLRQLSPDITGQKQLPPPDDDDDNILLGGGSDSDDNGDE